MKIMLDTNILISAFVFKSKTINEVIRKLTDEHEIVIASYCIEELKEVINEKFNIDINVCSLFHKYTICELVPESKMTDAVWDFVEFTKYLKKYQ